MGVSMKVLNVQIPPPEKDVRYPDLHPQTAIEGSILDGIAARTGADLIAYWYIGREYSGTGMAVLRANNKYFVFGLGHCYLYHALAADITADAVSRGGFDTLQDVLTGFFGKYRERETRYLVEAILKEEAPAHAEAVGRSRRTLCLED